MDNSVRVEESDAIATITLNRPKLLNAVDGGMAENLTDALVSLENSSDVRVVIICGAGSAFMAGGDLKPFYDSADQDPDFKRSTIYRQLRCVNQGIEIIHHMPKPVIASVHGAAAGFGLSLVLACDLAIAAEGTRFSTAYASVGTTPDGGATHMLPRLVGPKRAMELALLADTFSSDEAHQMGIVNRVVPIETLQAETLLLAERLVRAPAIAIARAKELIRSAAATTIEVQLRREMESFAACAVTNDFREGVAAFVENRKPVFKDHI